MGAVLTAPLGALSSCLGGCAASCCCMAMQSGTLTNDYAARQVLVWLQVFAATLAIFLAQLPSGWVSGPCEQIEKWAADIGICDCRHADNQDDCFADQLVYRVQTAAAGLFLVLVILSLSGCVSCAARSYVVAKFFIIVLAAFILLFVPNVVLTGLGAFASGASALFLVVQAVLVIDVAYSWSEQWLTNANAARFSSGTRGYRGWLGAILAAAVLALAATITGAVLLVNRYPSPANWALVGPALGGSLVLLVVSITEWCKHGSLLTSSVVAGYLIWMCYEALSVLPHAGYAGPGGLRWVEMIACAATIFGVARSTGLGHAAGGPPEASAPARLEGGEAGEAATDEPSDPKVYATQCFAHAAAAAYVCAALAPVVSWATFALRVAAAASALFLYGWSLVAPMLLTGRDFS